MGQIERLIEAVTDLLEATSLIKTSSTGGTQKLTIPADPFQIAGSAQPCRSVSMIQSNENPVYMNIGAVADADDFLIPKDIMIPLNYDDCSKLNFFGTANDVIQLIWRD